MWESNVEKNEVTGIDMKICWGCKFRKGVGWRTDFDEPNNSWSCTSLWLISLCHTCLSHSFSLSQSFLYCFASLSLSFVFFFAHFTVTSKYIATASKIDTIAHNSRVSQYFSLNLICICSYSSPLDAPTYWMKKGWLVVEILSKLWKKSQNGIPWAHQFASSLSIVRLIHGNTTNYNCWKFLRRLVLSMSTSRNPQSLNTMRHTVI